MSETLKRVPFHLRRYVVAQDYGAYDEIDQAVWKFVLRHTNAVLGDSAHPAYRVGLERMGITLDRIPVLVEMDRRLTEQGWGAVCVDGFIPPRAFQELQACSILPIAADIRSLDHLAYTPAPDIIHEAAGHAPILADLEYAAFLRRIGEVGYRSFALPHDEAVYQAIYALSVVKERAGVTAAEVRASERALSDAVAAVSGVSEAARVARLYWWTVEYGLVGSPSDYSIYGAGILSSLGESHFCHEPAVEKRVLDASCVDVDYDITRAQPQLFVTESFAHLMEVLEQVEAGLSQARGGVAGLEVAQASGEVACVELASGLQITGKLLGFERRSTSGNACHASGLHFGPGWALSLGGTPVAGFAGEDAADAPLTLALLPQAEAMGLEGPGAAPAEGTEVVRAEDDTPLAWVNRRAFKRDVGGGPQVQHLVAAGQRVGRVSAGPAFSEYFPPTSANPKRVPVPKVLSPERCELLKLYERAYSAFRQQLGPACVPLFESIHERLVVAHPREWLLRFHLLDSLITLGERSRLTVELARELRALEGVYRGEQPIATALAGLPG